MKEEKGPYYEENGYEELLGRYEQMIKYDKTTYFDVEEFEDIIDYFLDTRQFNKAFTAVEIGFQQHPNSHSLLLKKSQIFIDKGHPQEALKILDKIENIEFLNNEIPLTKGSAYCLIGKPGLAEKEFDKALAQSYDDKIDVIYDISNILTDCNQFKLAIKYLEIAKNIEKENADILYEIAYCYDRIDDINKAIEYYNKYLDEDPFAENVWFSLGEAYDRAEDYIMANKAYDYAVSINDKFIPGYLNKANNLLIEGKITDAIAIYKEVLELEKDNIQALCYIGEAFEKLSLFDKAKSYYNKALEIDITCADAWYGLGIIEMHLGNLNQSCDLINKAIKFDGGNGDFWFALGKIFIKLNSYNRAKIAFEKAIEIDAYDFEAWLLYSEILWNQGFYDDAIHFLLKGYKYNSDVSDINYRLAAYYIYTKQKNLAAQYLSRALSQNNKEYSQIFSIIKENKLPNYIKSIINKHNK